MYKLNESIQNIASLYSTNIDYYNKQIIDFLRTSLSELEFNISRSLNQIHGVQTLDDFIPANEYNIPNIEDIINSEDYFKVSLNNAIVVVAEPIDTDILTRAVQNIIKEIKQKSLSFTKSIEQNNNINNVINQIDNDCQNMKESIDVLQKYLEEINNAIKSFDDIITECTNINDEMDNIRPREPDVGENMITNDDNNENETEDDVFIKKLVNSPSFTTSDIDYDELKKKVITEDLFGGDLPESILDNTSIIHNKMINLYYQKKQEETERKKAELEKANAIIEQKKYTDYLTYLLSFIDDKLQKIEGKPTRYNLTKFLNDLDNDLDLDLNNSKSNKSNKSNESVELVELVESDESKKFNLELQQLNTSITNELKQLKNDIASHINQSVPLEKRTEYHSKFKEIFNINSIINLFLSFMKFNISYLNNKNYKNDVDALTKLFNNNMDFYNKDRAFQTSSIKRGITEVFKKNPNFKLADVYSREEGTGLDNIKRTIKKYIKPYTINMTEHENMMKRISWYFLFNNPIFPHFGDVYSNVQSYSEFLTRRSQHGGNIKDFNTRSKIHTNYIIDINKIHIQLIKKAKRFNLRYFQLYHYINHVRTYKLKLMENKKNTYYNFLYKGNISFFDTILTSLVKHIDDIENTNKSRDRKLIKPEIKWYYTIHYFIIKILQNFFRKLYTHWVDQKWKITHVINCIDENCQQITDLFSLFNSFSKVIFEYYSTLTPPVANYLRINKLPNGGRKDKKESFSKDPFNNKHFLVRDNLDNCTKHVSPTQRDNVSQIKFQEIFDPDEFPDNDSIPYYMGLADFINKGKSVMVLTYGYSGVGKTFTLFGKASEEAVGARVPEAPLSEAPVDPEENTGTLSIFEQSKVLVGGGGGIKGMLQSTLEQLGSDMDIRVKIFELYGLGVPYKFYWDDPEKVCHYIYSYKYNFDIGELSTSGPIKYAQFENYLNINIDNNYTVITSDNIKKFELIINAIDAERKKHGRIKATLNNEESSRSIMIYDFKIKLKKDNEGDADTYSHFVIMDLPGKEDIYTTFCDTDDPKYKIKEDLLQCKEIKLKNSDTDIIKNHLSNSQILKPPNESRTFSDIKYDKTLIKKMLFANPLFLSMIPEFAEMFEPEYLEVENLFTNQLEKIRQNENEKVVDKDSKIEINRWTIMWNKGKGGKERVFTNSYLPLYHTHYVYIKDGERKLVSNHKETKGQILDSQNNLVSDLAKVSDSDKLHITNGLTYLRVMGLFERSLHNMVTIIKKHNLEKLGSILNNMLEQDDENDNGGFKRRGYAGLEGIYINENILGLLQVLANKVQDTRGGNHVAICCKQIENYKDKLLVGHEEYIMSFNPDGQQNNTKPLRTSNFFSQIDYLNESQKLVLGSQEHHNKYTTRKEYINNHKKRKPDIDDNSEYIRTVKKDNVYDNVFRYPTTNKYKEFEKDIKNYDYNRIFNIEDPPIKTILKPYLDKIDNYYLFFVVSNNFKRDPESKEEIYNKETCHNQIGLLNDTQHFMKVIQGEDIDHMQCNEEQ